MEEVEKINEYLELIHKFLKWKLDISHIIKKIIPSVGIIRKLVYFVLKAILLLIFFSLIYMQYLF